MCVYLLTSDRSNRLERRTALIDKELFRLNVDIAALSEARLLEDRSLTESHFTFYWKGHPDQSAQTKFMVLLLPFETLLYLNLDKFRRVYQTV